MADLVRLQMFLDRHNPVIAREAVEAIYRDVVLLEQFPELGATASKPGQRLLSVRFGHAAYRVLYYLDGDAVIVTRVQHSRERR